MLQRDRPELYTALLAVKRWQDSPEDIKTREQNQELNNSHEAMLELLSELDLSWLIEAPDVRFSQWLTKFHRTGNIAPVELGMSREQLKELFGEPSDWNAIHPTNAAIWKYDDLEFHFDHGTLYLIHQDNEHGILTTIARRP